MPADVVHPSASMGGLIGRGGTFKEIISVLIVHGYDLQSPFVNAGRLIAVICPQISSIHPCFCAA
jgi:hypothetical protein